MYTILLVIHSIIVLFLIGMVLLQRSDSDGLSGLGGGGGNQFMTGRGAANFMTRTTAILATAFMITSLVLATMASRMNQGSIVDSVAEPAAAETPTATEKAIAEKTGGEQAGKDANKAEKSTTPAPAKKTKPAVPKAE